MSQKPPSGDINNNNGNGKSSSNNNHTHSPSIRQTLKQKLREHRRNQVFSLSSQGVRQEDIAKTLHITQASVSLDLNYLREKAKQSLSNYLESRFPLYFEECLLGVNDVVREAWNIYRTPGLSPNDKVHVLHLINSANELKIDLCSNGSVIEEAIKFTQVAKNKLIQIAPEKANQILHEYNNNNGNGGADDDDELQPQQQPQQKNGQQNKNDDDDDDIISYDDPNNSSSDYTTAADDNDNDNDNKVYYTE
jgi:hypothetical protein